MPWARSMVQGFGTSHARPGSAASGAATSPPGIEPPGIDSLPAGAGASPAFAAEGAGVIWMLMFHAAKANATIAAMAMATMTRMDMLWVAPICRGRPDTQTGDLPDGHCDCNLR